MHKPSRMNGIFFHKTMFGAGSERKLADFTTSVSLISNLIQQLAQAACPVSEAIRDKLVPNLATPSGSGIK
jgi:hypothetical protein